MRVMLVTMAVLLQAATAHAMQPAKANKVDRQTYCLAEIMQNEAEQNTPGRVSVGLVVLTRAESGHWGPKGDICALRVPNEFNYLMTKKYGPVKKPSAETMADAKQMMHGLKIGKPTLEPALQKQLAGSQYFHNPSSKPNWRKKFVKKGFVANHYIYYNPKQGLVLLYN